MSAAHRPVRRRIVIVRHAKSSWDDPTVADHDRPLAPRGRKALHGLRDHLESLALRPELVLCSSSRRTCETLDGIHSALGRHPHIEIDDGLYAADAEHLLARLRHLDDDVTTLVIIGHNPGVADLVDLLVTPSEEPAAEPVTGKFPTAAVALVSFTGHWRALQPAAAALDSFWAPRSAA